MGGTESGTVPAPAKTEPDPQFLALIACWAVLDNAARQTLAKMADFLASQQSPPQGPAVASTAATGDRLDMRRPAVDAVQRSMTALSERCAVPCVQQPMPTLPAEQPQSPGETSPVVVTITGHLTEREPVDARRRGGIEAERQALRDFRRGANAERQAPPSPSLN